MQKTKQDYKEYTLFDLIGILPKIAKRMGICEYINKQEEFFELNNEVRLIQDLIIQKVKDERIHNFYNHY